MEDGPQQWEIVVGSTESGEPLVVVSGEVDAAAQDDLREALETAGLRGRVVVDLRGVRFIDSAGLNVLLEAWRSPAGILIRNPSPRVRAVMELADVPELLEGCTFD